MTVGEFLDKVNAELGKPELAGRRIVQIVSLGRDFADGTEVSGVGFYLDQGLGIRPDAASRVCIVDERCEG